MTPAIYLDHNATSPIAPAVADAIDACRRRAYGNPTSQHAAGRAARRELETARRRIAELLGARTGGTRPDRLVLTSGGTESNTLALRGLAGPPPGRVVVSAIEHPSVSATADQMRGEGYAVSRVGVDSRGIVRVEELEQLLTNHGDVAVVSVMLGNNETGVLQPIERIAAVCAARGVAMHTDAVQAVGKIDVDFATLGATAMSFTAHKFHGPLGVGGLVLRAEAKITPLAHGGFQQEGLRPGTESVDLAVGMRTALELWREDREQRPTRMANLRDRLEQTILAEIPGAVAVGGEAPRLPHTACVAFAGLDRQALVMALDLAGVACSTGSACASGSSEPSPTLLAMGLPNNVVQGAIRLSLGAFSTQSDVLDAAARITRVAKGLEPQKTGEF